MTRNILFILLISFSTISYGQQKVFTFQEAQKAGHSYEELDKKYKSAVHNDTKLAVFKSPEEQKQLQTAYVTFFRNLNSYLAENGFEWETVTRCFNRIYMNEDGTIEYFLLNFMGGSLSEKKQNVFTSLLEDYISNNKFPITASEKFAQCSPITYKP